MSSSSASTYARSSRSAAAAAAAAASVMPPPAASPPRSTTRGGTVIHAATATALGLRPGAAALPSASASSASSSTPAASSASSATAAAWARANQVGSGRAAAQAATQAVTALSSSKRKRNISSIDGTGPDAPGPEGPDPLDFSGARASLVQFVVQPVFFKPPGLGQQPHLVRLVRMYTPSAAFNDTAAAASSHSHTAAASSTTAAAAAASPSPSSLTPPSGLQIDTFVRASDLCLTIMQSKSGAHQMIRDFNQPYEKTLLRLPAGSVAGGGGGGGGGQGAGGGRPEVYCLTRKGVQRFALTKKVRTHPHLAKWINEVLLVLMRPGNEGMTIGGGGGRGASQGAKQSEEEKDKEDESTAGEEGEEDEDRAAAAAAAAASLAASLKSLPAPSPSVLTAWIAASLSTAAATLKVDEAREARQVQAKLVAAALPSHAPGGSSAGKDWVGGDAAAGKFEGKSTRLGAKFQAIIPDKLSRAQQSKYVRVFVGEELVYDPRAPPVARLPPFVPAPCLLPSNPASRRYARALWEAEQHDLRRTSRRGGGGPGAGMGAGGAGGSEEGLTLVDTSMDALHAASALQIERQLASMQQDMRERVETRLVFSAFTKAYKAQLKLEKGPHDFEESLLELFVPAGRIQSLFTDPRLGVLPDPRGVRESFDVMATAFVPMREWMAAQQEQLLFDAEVSSKRARTENGYTARRSRASSPSPSPSLSPSPALLPAAPTLSSAAAALAASSSSASNQNGAQAPSSLSALQSVVASSSPSGWQPAGAAAVDPPSRVLRPPPSVSVVPPSPPPPPLPSPVAASPSSVSTLRSSLASLPPTRALQTSVKLPPPIALALAPPLESLPSSRRRVQALQERPRGAPHFPMAASHITQQQQQQQQHQSQRVSRLAPAVGASLLSSAAYQSPPPHLRPPASGTRSGAANSLGLKATALKAPPSLAQPVSMLR